MRYGRPDRTRMDPAEFEPPDGAFYVGYRDDGRWPWAAGASGPT